MDTHLPSPGVLPDPGIEPRSPALQVVCLPFELPGKVLSYFRPRKIPNIKDATKLEGDKTILCLSEKEFWITTQNQWGEKKKIDECDYWKYKSPQEKKIICKLKR